MMLGCLSSNWMWCFKEFKMFRGSQTIRNCFWKIWFTLPRSLRTNSAKRKRHLNCSSKREKTLSTDKPFFSLSLFKEFQNIVKPSYPLMNSSPKVSWAIIDEMTSWLKRPSCVRRLWDTFEPLLNIFLWNESLIAHLPPTVGKPIGKRFDNIEPFAAQKIFCD